MIWRSPEYAYLFLLALPAGILFWLDARGRRRVREKLRPVPPESPHPFPIRQSLQLILASAVFALIVLALCRPQWGSVEEKYEMKGIDIIVALDTSRSMLADDIAPNRLGAAKDAIRKLVPRLRGDRIGLLAFAGSAFTVCPLTTDYDAFEKAVAEADAGTIPLGGTSFAAMLTEASRSFSFRGERGRILVILSDGEDHGGDLSGPLQRLSRSAVRIYSVSTGTEFGGPVRLPGGGFLKDASELVVRSRVQPAVLDLVSSTAGGFRTDLSAGPEVLADLYDRRLAGLERKKVSVAHRRLRERFQIPLGLALSLLLVLPFVGGEKRRNTR
jgi:Ca-activated chloride channel family protein